MNNQLYHYGIKGMKWGVRRTPEQLGHYSDGKKRKIAKKDAKRYVKAKMGYGEGAGTRRKLLKAELSEKMKDSTYKSAFDNYVENANYEKAGRAAKRERRIRDITSNKVIRTGAKIAGVAAAVGVGYKIASQNPVAQRKAKAFVDGIKQIGIVDLFASGQYTKTGRAYVLGNLLKDAVLA